MSDIHSRIPTPHLPSSIADYILSEISFYLVFNTIPIHGMTHEISYHLIIQFSGFNN